MVDLWQEWTMLEEMDGYVMQSTWACATACG